MSETNTFHDIRTTGDFLAGAKVTQCSTDDITEVVCSSVDDVRRPPNQNMKGFHPTFVDIVDFVLRLTHWMYSSDLKVVVPVLCENYYADKCTIHTPGQEIIGRQAIIDETQESLKVFPDQIWYSENVVWSLEEGVSSSSSDSPTYYASQLVVSHMTHKGTSTIPSFKMMFGTKQKPTYKRARHVLCIVDSVCHGTRIIEAWTIRDNSHLLQQLGINFRRVAIDQAKNDYRQSQYGHDQPPHIIDRLDMEMDRVRRENDILSESKLLLVKSKIPTPPSSDPKAYVVFLMNVLWRKRKINQQQQQEEPENSEQSATIEDLYDGRIKGHFPGGRDVYGHTEIQDYFSKYLRKGLSKISVSVDHVACIPYMPSSTATTTVSERNNISNSVNDNENHPEAVDIAVRWTLVATHSGRHPLLGAPSNRPVYILASSHFRILKGHKIREEWTVWDEVALLRQAEIQRMIHQTNTGGDKFEIFVNRTIIVLAVALAIFIKLRFDGFVLSESWGLK